MKINKIIFNLIIVFAAIKTNINMFSKSQGLAEV